MLQAVEGYVGQVGPTVLNLRAYLREIEGGRARGRDMAENVVGVSPEADRRLAAIDPLLYHGILGRSRLWF